MRKYNIFVIFIVFLFIYVPPIGKINVLHILGAISWIYIILNNSMVSKIINLNLILKIYAVLSFFWLYLLTVTLVNGTSILNTSFYLFWMFDVIPICIMLNVYFSVKKFKINDFLNILMIVGTIQGVLSIASFFSSNIQDFFVNQLINYGYSERITELASFRIYGFASNLTFSTPIVQGVLTSVSLYLAITKKWNYILFTPLLLFSAIINARTAFVIIAVGIILIFFVGIKIKISSIIRFVVITVVFSVIINVGMSALKENSKETYDWVITGFDEIIQFVESGPNQNVGYFSYISNPEKYTLPDGLNAVFGIGARILNENNYGARSDIGYVNDIWLGGIIYSICLYLFFLLILVSIGKTNKEPKYLSILLLCTLIFSNIKGYIFGLNNLTNLLFLIFTFIVLRKKDLEEE